MSEIEIDGKLRRITFSYNAVADAEKEADMGFASMMSENRIGFHVLRILLWAGMKAHEPGLTVQRTGMLIDSYLGNDGTLDKLMETIMKAVQESKMFAKSGNVEAGGE